MRTIYEKGDRVYLTVSPDDSRLSDEMRKVVENNKNRIFTVKSIDIPNGNEKCIFYTLWDADILPYCWEHDMLALAEYEPKLPKPEEIGQDSGNDITPAPVTLPVVTIYYNKPDGRGAGVVPGYYPSREQAEAALEEDVKQSFPEGTEFQFMSANATIPLDKARAVYEQVQINNLAEDAYGSILDRNENGDIDYEKLEEAEKVCGSRNELCRVVADSAADGWNSGSSHWENVWGSTDCVLENPEYYYSLYREKVRKS